MCIICYKPAGAPLPGFETLERCARRNPHGAGFALARDGRVIVRKGFGRVVDLLEALVDAAGGPEAVEALPAILHFRLATHGSVCPANCQPLPLSARLEDVKALSAECAAAMAHNGIYSGVEFRPEWPDVSDTQAMVLGRLSGMSFAEIAARKEEIAAMLGPSRTVLLDASGEALLFGGWEREGSEDGKPDLCWSNAGFRDWPAAVSRCGAFPARPAPDDRPALPEDEVALALVGYLEDALSELEWDPDTLADVLGLEPGSAALEAAALTAARIREGLSRLLEPPEGPEDGSVRLTVAVRGGRVVAVHSDGPADVYVSYGDGGDAGPEFHLARVDEKTVREAEEAFDAMIRGRQAAFDFLEEVTP